MAREGNVYYRPKNPSRGRPVGQEYSNAPVGLVGERPRRNEEWWHDGDHGGGTSSRPYQDRSLIPRGIPFFIQPLLPTPDSFDGRGCFGFKLRGPSQPQRYSTGPDHQQPYVPFRRPVYNAEGKNERIERNLNMVNEQPNRLLFPEPIRRQLTAIERRLQQDSFPIMSFRTEIIRALQSPKARLVVTAATGSGKSTCIPALLAVATPFGHLPCDSQGTPPRWIIISQPRAFAARNIIKGIKRYLGDTDTRPMFWPEAEVLQLARSAFGTPGYDRKNEHANGNGYGYQRAKCTQHIGAQERPIPEAGHRWLPRVITLTEAALLRVIGEYGGLPAAAVVILDEAHERTAELDCLLSMLTNEVAVGMAGGGSSQLLKRRPTRVIVTSATVDAEFFRGFLGRAKILSCNQRLHEITTRVVNVSEEYPGKTAVSVAVDLCVNHVQKACASEIAIANRAQGDGSGGGVLERLGLQVGTTLVFLPGKGECVQVSQQLHDKLSCASPHPLFLVRSKCEATAPLDVWLSEISLLAAHAAGQGLYPVLVLTLYGALPVECQDRVMCERIPPSLVRIVLTTSIAETSVTVPQVATVIDLGLQKIPVYVPERMCTVLRLVQASASQQQQRAGRAGRVRPGHCVRVVWPGEGPHGVPAQEEGLVELRRTDLTHLILRLRLMGIRLEDLRLPDPPDPSAVQVFLTQLRDHGALTPETKGGWCMEEVTEIGRRIARLPVSVPLARAFLDLVDEGWAVYAAAAVACLTTGTEMLWWGSGLEREQRREIIDRHGSFFSEESDITTLANMFLEWFANGFGKESAAKFAINVKVAQTDREVFTAVLAYGAGIHVTTTGTIKERIMAAAPLLVFDRKRAQAAVSRRLVEVCVRQKHTAELCGAMVAPDGTVHLLYTPDDKPTERFRLTRPGFTVDSLSEGSVSRRIVFFERVYTNSGRQGNGSADAGVRKGGAFQGYLGLSIGLGAGDDDGWLVGQLGEILGNVLPKTTMLVFPKKIPVHAVRILQVAYSKWRHRVLCFRETTRDETSEPHFYGRGTAAAAAAAAAACVGLDRVWFLGTRADWHMMGGALAQLVWVLLRRAHRQHSISIDVPGSGQAVLLRPDCGVESVRLAPEDGAPEIWPMHCRYLHVSALPSILDRLPIDNAPESWPRFTVEFDHPISGFTVYFLEQRAYSLLVPEAPTGENGGGGGGGGGGLGGRMSPCELLLEVCFTAQQANLVHVEGASNFLGLARVHDGMYRGWGSINTLGLIRQVLQHFTRFQGNVALPTKLIVTSRGNRTQLVKDMAETLMFSVEEETGRLFGDQVRVIWSWMEGASFRVVLAAWPTHDPPPAMLLQEAADVLRQNLEWKHVSNVTADVAIRHVARLTIDGSLAGPITHSLEPFGVLLHVKDAPIGPKVARTGEGEGDTRTVVLQSISPEVLASARAAVEAVSRPFVPLLPPLAAAFLGPFFPANGDLQVLAQAISAMLEAYATRLGLALIPNVSPLLAQGVSLLHRNPQLLPPSPSPHPTTPPPPTTPTYSPKENTHGEHSEDEMEEGWDVPEDSVVPWNPIGDLAAPVPDPEPISGESRDLVDGLAIVAEMQQARGLWLHPVMAGMESGAGMDGHVWGKVLGMAGVCRANDERRVGSVLARLGPLLESGLVELAQACEKVQPGRGLALRGADTCLYVCAGAANPLLARPYRLECGHTLCMECHAAQVAARVQSANGAQLASITLSCTVCRQSFTPRDMHNALLHGPHEENLWREWVRTEGLVHLRQRGAQCFVCPMPNCGRYMLVAHTPTSTQCRGCQAFVCRACQRPDHPEMDCNGRRVALGLLAGQKACPCCGLGTEKMDGCNHMLCPACSEHWCWTCGWASSRHPGIGIYTHMASERHYE